MISIQLSYEEKNDKKLWELARDYEDVRREFTIEVELLYDGD